MRKINDLGKRAAALALAASLVLSTVPPVLAADTEADTPPAQTQQQETDADTETDTDADEAAALPELSEDWAVETAGASLKKWDPDKWKPPVDPDKWIKDLINEGMDKAKEEIRKNSQKYIPEHTHEYTCDGETVSEATCTKAKQVKYRCNYTYDYLIKDVVGFDPTEHGIYVTVPLECNDTKVLSVGTELGHDFDEAAIEALKPCQTKTFTCRRNGCSETKTITATAPHTPGEWEVLSYPTCTENGKRVKKCTECGEILKTDTDSEDMKELGHDFEGAEWVEEAATCTTPGQRYQVCQREGCSERNLDTDYTAAHPKLGHVLSEFVDDDKPGCQQQTATAHCTREGCSYTEHKDLKNFGADGKPVPHKYTTYKMDENLEGVVTRYKGTCDYCGETHYFDAVPNPLKDDKDTLKEKTENANNWLGYQGAITAMETVKVDNKKVDERAAEIVDDALKAAQDAVRNAKTKEEAVAALDQISKTVKQELSKVNISAGSLNTDVKISADDLNKALKPLDDTVESLKDSLNDSFLSQGTIENLVDKLATDVTDSSAPQKGIHQLIYNTVYDTVYNAIPGNDTKKTTDNAPAIRDMVLELVDDVVTSNAGWNDLTDTLVDDAVDLAMEELMKNEKVAKLLKTKLGTETMDEVRAEIRQQLVDDPQFMSDVRAIAGKATANAKYGAEKGWSDQKIMDRLQADLLPDITVLVSDRVNKLGDSAEQIANKKVEDTVHKFLPGKLGDWVSNKINEKVSPTVQNEVQKLDNKVEGLISSYIKQFTCLNHNYVDMELRAATCTEKGQRGKVCTKCGKTKDKYDTDPLNHVEVIDPAVEPTETATGLTEGSHCSRCGAVLTAQKTVSMLDPTIYSQFERADITPAEAEQAGYDSVEAACAALDAALTQAGFDPASAEHFTLQVNSSIGALPADRFPRSGVTGTLSVPAAADKAKTFYVVQLYTARSPEHEAGDIVVTPVEVWGKEMTLTVCGRTITAIAWKAE